MLTNALMDSMLMEVLAFNARVNAVHALMEMDVNHAKLAS